MAVLEVKKYGDPILRKLCANVDDFSNLGPIIEDMFDTMYEEEGIGLAANQVNFDMNLFILDIPGEDDDDEGEQRVFINSEIINTKGEAEFEEGCLSVPGVKLTIARPEYITLKYQDETGKEFQEEFDDFSARAIQHEMDHLNGRLIIDRVSSIEKMKFKKELDDIKKQAGQE